MIVDSHSTRQVILWLANDSDANEQLPKALFDAEWDVALNELFIRTFYEECDVPPSAHNIWPGAVDWNKVRDWAEKHLKGRAE